MVSGVVSPLFEELFAVIIPPLRAGSEEIPKLVVVATRRLIDAIILKLGQRPFFYGTEGTAGTGVRSKLTVNAYTGATYVSPDKATLWTTNLC